MICAEQVLIRKQIIRHTDPVKIKLVAVVPFEDQAAKWNERDREKYFNVLSKCDEVITLNKQYQSGCHYERNRYMADNSSRLVCYYDGSGGGAGYMVEYAESKSISIVNILDSHIVQERKHKRAAQMHQ